MPTLRTDSALLYQNDTPCCYSSSSLLPPPLVLAIVNALHRRYICLRSSTFPPHPFRSPLAAPFRLRARIALPRSDDRRWAVIWISYSEVRCHCLHRRRRRQHAVCGRRGPIRNPALHARLHRRAREVRLSPLIISVSRVLAPALILFSLSLWHILDVSISAFVYPCVSI